MNFRISLFIFLAVIALFSSVGSIYFERAAQHIRTLLENNTTLILQQSSFNQANIGLLFFNEESISEIHALPLYKARKGNLEQKKISIFHPGRATTKMHLQHESTIDTSESDIDIENKLRSDLKGKLNKIAQASKEILDTTSNEQLQLLNVEQFQNKFFLLQALIESRISLNYSQQEKRVLINKDLEMQAIALSDGSRYLILFAFFIEILLFILIQFLEVKTERRVR